MDKISDLLERFNTDTDLKAENMIKNGKIKGGGLQGFALMKFIFFKSFFIKKGYKKGAIGFFSSFLEALYPIISYAKAKEHSNENR